MDPILGRSPDELGSAQARSSDPGLARCLLIRAAEIRQMPTRAVQTKTRIYIDGPFGLSEYDGDVNDQDVEFWCKECRCPAEVDIDPVDGEVEAIRCPKEGSKHFDVQYVLMELELPEDLDEDEEDWELDPCRS